MTPLILGGLLGRTQATRMQLRGIQKPKTVCRREASDLGSENGSIYLARNTVNRRAI